MKKLNLGIVSLSIIIGLTGCGSTWVNLDNSKASDLKVETAKTKCKYDDKQYALMKEQSRIDNLISILDMTAKGEKEWKDLSKEKEKEFNEEMNKCMKQEKLTREK